MIMTPMLLATTIAAAPVPKETGGLEGKWQLVESEEKGLPAEKPDEPMTLTVKGSEMVFRRGTDTVTRISFDLDFSRSPAHLDLKFGSKGVCHAILRVEKDELVMCAGSKFVPDEPANRPKEFVTGPPEDRPQKGKLLFRFKRIRK